MQDNTQSSLKNKPEWPVRLALLSEIADLEKLIHLSVNGLQAATYSDMQRSGALGSVFGVDSQLIQDGTYFVVERDSMIIGCGGWSRRKKLCGSSHVGANDGEMIDPLTEPARIRAFFVHPDWARQGVGTSILHASEMAAYKAGFTRLELAATLAGVPLYQVHGYTMGEKFSIALANGEQLPVIRMSKEIFPAK